MKEHNQQTPAETNKAEENNRATISDTMIEVNAATYSDIATKLKESIGNSCYYNGKIDSDHGNIYSTFTATLIVYRTDESYPEGTFSTISDIVPVWWEYSTHIAGDGEVLNDFCFSTLKEALLTAN